MNTPENFTHVVAVGVDIQNDFTPGGSLAVAGGDEVVRPFNNVANWVRYETGLVVFTRDWHPEETNHFGNPPNFNTTWPVHCVANTLGAQFHPDLDVTEHDTVMSKGMEKDEDAYSGFQAHAHNGSTLETIIYPVRHDRVAVFIGGLATDYCVKATVLDALKYADKFEDDPLRDVDVFVLADAIRAVDPFKGFGAVEEMKSAGARFVTSDEVVNNQVANVREYQWNH